MELTLRELLRYTSEERDRWRAWFLAHSEGMAVELQSGGRFATVGALVDHIFLVERRHLQRLTNQPLDTQTGLSGHHAPPLFDYGASVRREFEQFTTELDPDVATQPRRITLQDGSELSITPRKLLFHCLLHEVRHWAQIALAVRRAGLEPPGNHDLLFSKALQ